MTTLLALLILTATSETSRRRGRQHRIILDQPNARLLSEDDPPAAKSGSSSGAGAPDAASGKKAAAPDAAEADAGPLRRRRRLVDADEPAPLKRAAIKREDSDETAPAKGSAAAARVAPARKGLADDGTGATTDTKKRATDDDAPVKRAAKNATEGAAVAAAGANGTSTEANATATSDTKVEALKANADGADSSDANATATGDAKNGDDGSEGAKPDGKLPGDNPRPALPNVPKKSSKFWIFDLVPGFLSKTIALGILVGIVAVLVMVARTYFSIQKPGPSHEVVQADKPLLDTEEFY
jgi:hypothetical protein